MERSYRIKANVGKDQVLNVNLKRDIDLYEVLSLKINQEKIYKLHSSNYGVIVGRVLANDAFGIPNAKVSVFIPISNEDKLRSEIKEIYPYTFVNTFNSDNIRFNTLPDYVTKDCYKPVGTFPSKRMVLDEDVKLEIQDKYYKYTTITNNAGDYMIFGVPVGKQVVHVDIDLSDIGVLSQRPTDFIYKGYSIDLFESPVEFKTSTNLSDLPQIISENSTVNVYPFWGDKNENEIAITRKDIRIQYKFEPTCVFLGSVITDSSVNSISHDCTPDVKMGEAGQLVSADGTIEMIRKTVDDKVEEFAIKGNKLIDGDGVFCYQIPMNLDFVCTDEYGNIVPTDNPNRGLPTRTRVRFRATLNESDNDTISSHKARYLIPNNPDLLESSTKPFVNENVFDEEGHYYEFGTLTNDDCFRDLLWNKVYSVKSYIPRIQRPFGAVAEKSQEYLAIKGVNKKDARSKNPIPYNKLNLNYSMSFFRIVEKFLDADFDEEAGNSNSFKEFWYFLNGNQMNYSIDAIYEKLLDDMDGIGLDFYNDWLNGCLYFPNWHWYVKSKKLYSGKESKYDSKFCDCNKQISEKDDNKLCVLNNCSLPYDNNDLTITSGYTDSVEMHFSFTKMAYGSKQFKNGIIKKTTNKDGAEVYYYSFGQPCSHNENPIIENGETYINYVRLFSTDIILLGSLVDCDIHGIPKISQSLPSTTSTIPPMGRFKLWQNTEKNRGIDDEAFNTNSNVDYENGMNWGQKWHSDNPCDDYNSGEYSGRNRLSTGLFFGLTKIHMNTKDSYWECNNNNNLFAKIGRLFKNVVREFIMPLTAVKTCVNAERICELGVTNDLTARYTTDKGKNVYVVMDGLITRKELQDIDTRALFATLNSNKLITKIESDTTGYKTYNMFYLYPVNFDGRLANKIRYFNDDNSTKDIRNKDYLDYRFGSISNYLTIYQDYTYGGVSLSGTRARSENDEDRSYTNESEVKKSERHFYGDSEIETAYAFPLYNNSFYFYFGLNPAHNAISEFYENFMHSCESVLKKESFNISFSVVSADWCESNGSIHLTVNGASMPYTVVLTDEDGDEIEKIENVTDKNVEITGLYNNNYLLSVTDSDGNTVSDTAFLNRTPITLEYHTLENDGRLYLDACINNGIPIYKAPVGIPVYDNEINCNAGDNNTEMTITKDDIIITLKSTKEGERMCTSGLPGEYDGFIDLRTHNNGESLFHFHKPNNITEDLVYRTFKYKIEDRECSENFSEGTFIINFTTKTTDNNG